ncbi:MAG: heme-copper oxidase subunit III [Saprospiraceae bacterium]
MSSSSASSRINHPFDHDGPSPFHPMNIIMILSLIGIAVLFLAFSAAFIYSRMQADLPPVDMPWMFGVNSLVLLGSSYTIGLATKAFKADDTEAYKKALLWTMGLSMVFLVLQIVAWQTMFDQNIFPSTDNSAGYLYVLSGLHFAHVIAGLPFIIGFFLVARKRMREPVSVLVYFSDPEKRLKLKMLTMYWHFMDALWIYLVLFLFINRLLY